MDEDNVDGILSAVKILKQLILIMVTTYLLSVVSLSMTGKETCQI